MRRRAAWLVILTLAAWGIGASGEARGGTSPADEPTPGQNPGAAPADSLEDFVPGGSFADWDSVTAAYDATVRRQGDRRLRPLFGLRLNKVEGAHLEFGASLTDARFRLAPVEGTLGYDLARERLNFGTRLRFELRDDRWLLEAVYRDDAQPYGCHRPYGNTWLALLGGYDAMQYLREREGGLALCWRPSEERQIWLGWVRTEQDPLRAISDTRIFGGERWMVQNDPADPVLTNGIRLRARRAPAYLGEPATRGLVTESQLTIRGGEFLGGSREYSELRTDLWLTRPARHGNLVHLRASGSLAVGRPPRQAWPDLGGDAGLRAFPPRGFDTPDTLIGYGRLLTRLEIQSRAAQIKRTRLPILKNLGMRLIPFAEVGAIWGRARGPGTISVQPLRELQELRLPRRRDVRWDLGLGLRQNVDYAGVLSYAEIDFAWPMGSDTGPARITVQFSKDGLD